MYYCFEGRNAMSNNLNDTLTFTENGNEITITMYAGILSKIGKAIGGPDGLDKIAYDTEIQEKLVEAILTKYDPEGNACGKHTTLFSLSVDNFSEILSWGIEHYSFFIVNSSRNMLEKMSKLQKEIAEAEKTLIPTNNG